MSEKSTTQDEEVEEIKYENELDQEDFNHLYDFDYDLELYPGCKIIKEFNMDEELKNQAIEIILANYIKEFPSYDKVAEGIKIEMDKIRGGLWHCAVGRGFSFSIDFEQYLFYVSIDGFVGVMLWKG